MSLKGPEAPPTPEDIKLFEEIAAARANLKDEGRIRYEALGEQDKTKYQNWKQAQDQAMLLQHTPSVIFSKAVNPPEEILRALAGVETADNSASPAPKKKKKFCALQ